MDEGGEAMLEEEYGDDDYGEDEGSQPMGENNMFEALA